MPRLRFKTRYWVFVAPLFLAACGEGLERVSYAGFPYGGDRTAGSGVAYVRASLLPKRGPVIEAAQPENSSVVNGKEKMNLTPKSTLADVVKKHETEPAAPVEEKESGAMKAVDTKSGDKVFSAKQRK